jgi:hypothetical protein
VRKLRPVTIRAGGCVAPDDIGPMVRRLTGVTPATSCSRSSRSRSARPASAATQLRSASSLPDREGRARSHLRWRDGRGQDCFGGTLNNRLHVQLSLVERAAPSLRSARRCRPLRPRHNARIGGQRRPGPSSWAARATLLGRGSSSRSRSSGWPATGAANGSALICGPFRIEASNAIQERASARRLHG